MIFRDVTMKMDIQSKARERELSAQTSTAPIVYNKLPLEYLL
jgi:hypothetical protein